MLTQWVPAAGSAIVAAATGSSLCCSRSMGYQLLLVVASVVAAATLALVLWARSVLIQYVKLLLAAAFAAHFAALGGAADGTEQCSYDT